MVLKSCSAKCPTHLKKNVYQFYSLKKIGLSTKYHLQFPEDDSLSPFALTSRLRRFHNTRYFLWNHKALLYPLVPVFPLISYYTCFSSWDTQIQSCHVQVLSENPITSQCFSSPAALAEPWGWAPGKSASLWAHLLCCVPMNLSKTLQNQCSLQLLKPVSGPRMYSLWLT